MTEPDSNTITGVPKVEDVMAALAMQSIFDLQTVARKMVEEAQRRAEDENDPGDLDVLIGRHYVFYHDELPIVQ